MSSAERQKEYRARNAKALSQRTPQAMRKSTATFLRRNIHKFSRAQFEGALDLAHSLGLIDTDGWTDWRNKKRAE